MTTPDTKIVNFETVQASKQKTEQKPLPTRIVSELRTIYSKDVTELLQRLFAVIDDELFKRSDRADSIAQQSQYFETMRHIRVESASMQSHFHMCVYQSYDEFWKKIRHSSASADAKEDESRESEFSLLENDALEEDIAVSAMVEKGNNLFQTQITALNKRLAFLLGREEELDTNENPFSPHVLCHAFSETLKSLSLDVSIKLLIFKLFDQITLSGLGKLYSELNTFLSNEGILPTLSRNIRRPSTLPSGSGARSAYPGAENEEQTENQQAYIEVFQGMQNLLDGWRTQMGFPPLFSEGGATGPVVEATEVLSALSSLQSPMILPPGTLANAMGLKSYLAEQIMTQPGQGKSLARPEEDIIDMVALIFDFILEDRNLPDSVKGLIARLQIPVVKVAIIEKSFFGRKNHPVRLLLNALAQAGIGLDTSESVTETPIFKKIESVTTRILDEFDQNVGLFSELLDEFMAFMDKEVQRSRIAEERTRQVTQSKEQLHLAKRKIAYEIATRLEGKTTPAIVRSFLFNIWKDVLVLAYLRRDKQPTDWENALIVMDKLIWTVLPPTDATERKAIIQTIPRLLKAVRVGLESISMDPQSVTTALKDLESCHVACLSKGGHSESVPDHSNESEDTVGAAVKSQDSQGVEIRDPELAQAISEIQCNLPDIENFSIQDLCRSPIDTDGPLHHSTVEEEESLFKIQSMEVGQWVEFDEGKKRIRGKLSWKSQVTSTYVFVNRKGAKVMEIALNELSKRMRENTARVIEDAGTPLMDRAFGALLGKLKSPQPISPPTA